MSHEDQFALPVQFAPAVEFKQVTKSYGAVHALQDVSLAVPFGQMSAIVGENGAGKTTLMRVLYGATSPDSGQLLIDGKPLEFHSTRQATSAGVGMVSQHYGIIPELTCLQNLILGAEPSIALNLSTLQHRAQELADQMGFDFAWKQAAAQLSPSAMQKLEILKLLWRNSRIMILDEPTAMLSPRDADALFESMAKLLNRGSTVLLVTHRVREVTEHCSRVAVMRAGKLVADMDVAQTNERELSRLIVGEAFPHAQASVQALPKGLFDSQPVLALNNLTVKSDRGHNALSDVSFEVRPGELVGIAGVDGNGQRELLMTVAGLMSPEKGELRLLGGLNEASSLKQRITAGLRLVPEDRHSEAIISDWNLLENTALGLQFLPPEANGRWIDTDSRQKLASQIVDRFRTKNGGLDKPIASLSGGNQQRLVVARALALSPKLIMAFQPVRGLDLGATAAIYAAIKDACAEGMAAVIVSFDLDELLVNCPRILVLNQGRLSEPPKELALDRSTIGDLMVGAA